MGYDEEDTVGYVAARDRLLRALDCCVFLAVSGIEWRAVWFLFQGLIRFAVCATVSTPSNLERPKMPQSAVQRFTERRLSLGNRRHDAIVKKFEEFLEKHPDRQLYLPEICSAIGSCERTTACEEHFGMGPIRYLTLRRMHFVHQSLLRADAGKSSVTRILTDQGFWELGRSSVAYRKLFGETPLQTLRRSAEQSGRHRRVA